MIGAVLKAEIQFLTACGTDLGTENSSRLLLHRYGVDVSPAIDSVMEKNLVGSGIFQDSLVIDMHRVTGLDRGRLNRYPIVTILGRHSVSPPSFNQYPEKFGF